MCSRHSGHFLPPFLAFPFKNNSTPHQHLPNCPMGAAWFILVWAGLFHVTMNREFGRVSPTATVTVSLSPCEFHLPFEVSTCLCFLERRHPRLVCGRFYDRAGSSFPRLSLMLGWAWAKWGCCLCPAGSYKLGQQIHRFSEQDTGESLSLVCSWYPVLFFPPPLSLGLQIPRAGLWQL